MVPGGTLNCPQDGSPIAEIFKQGDRLADKYEFISVIGSGGMGIIYKARQALLDKTVAIKMLHPHLMNSGALIRFHREAKAASSLSHINLVGVHDFGTTDSGQPYMVMDYVDGKSLADIIKERGRLPVKESIDVAMQVASGLAHLHQKGILHRDLKPSNIMLTDSGVDVPVARILDFGIAKIVEGEDAQTLTKTGDVFGSPLYMSPEQGTGGGLDSRSDYYSLGCLIFESLVGTPPHVGKTALETVLLHMNEDAPTLKQASLGVEFPASLESTVARLLKRNPDDRYQSLVDLMEDLTIVKEEVTGTTAGSDTLSRRDLRELASAPASGKAKKESFWDSSKAAAFRKYLEEHTLLIVFTCLTAFLVLGAFMVALTNFNNSPAVTHEKEIHPDLDYGKRALSHDEAEGSDLHELMKERVRKDSKNFYFGLRTSSLDDRDIPLFKICKNLRVLDIESNEIKGHTLGELAGLPDLQTLRLDDNPIDDDALIEINKLIGLRELRLSQTRISGNGLRHLTALKNLSILSLGNSNITSDSLRYLSQLKSLKDLDLKQNRMVTDEGLEHLTKIPGLSTIDLTRTGVRGSGLLHLAKLPNLKTLVIKHTLMPESMFIGFGKLSRLKNLDLESGRFDAENLRHLYGLKKLEDLNLSGCRGISSEAVDEFKRHLPACRIQFQPG